MVMVSVLLLYAPGSFQPLQRFLRDIVGLDLYGVAHDALSTTARKHR
jgi:hypothetical protein